MLLGVSNPRPRGVRPQKIRAGLSAGAGSRRSWRRWLRLGSNQALHPLIVNTAFSQFVRGTALRWGRGRTG